MAANPSKELLAALQARFEAHPARHGGVAWSEVQARLAKHKTALRALAQMEATGGEPDVVGRDTDGAILFADCAAESPEGRRSLCYDEAALSARKENRPAGSAVALAAAMV